MKLRDIFEKHRERKFNFIEPGGNWGDHLIYVGARKLADDLRIDYRTCSYKDRFGPSDIVYVHGNADFNDFGYGGAPTILKWVRRKYPSHLLIVGPSTSILDTDYVKRIFCEDDNKLVFFAREEKTYQHVKTFCSSVCIDEDTSLHLHKDDEIFRSFTRNAPIRKEHRLLVRRIDEERTEIPKDINPRDFDIVCDPCKMTRNDWIDLHFKASKITTNRLHSAILGTILGKEVELFANSYHKNRSVWEYNLKSKGVSWVGPVKLDKACYRHARLKAFGLKMLRRVRSS